MTEKGNIPLHTLPSIQFLASDHSTAFGEHMPSHRINFYAIVWFKADGETHFIDFEPYPIKKNMVYLIGKDQVHSIPAPVMPQARTIVFSSSFFERIEEPFIRQLFIPFHNAGIQIPAAMTQPLTDLFQLILLEEKAAADTTLLLKYTSALLIHLHRINQQTIPSESSSDTRLFKLYQLVAEHFKDNRSAVFYASQIGLTTKRINELLRQRSGITINGLINQLLLLEAKRELFHNHLSIKQIAYNLGFSDQSYFARFFKKHAGITPEQFKSRPTS